MNKKNFKVRLVKETIGEKDPQLLYMVTYNGEYMATVLLNCITCRCQIKDKSKNVRRIEEDDGGDNYFFSEMLCEMVARTRAQELIDMNTAFIIPPINL